MEAIEIGIARTAADWPRGQAWPSSPCQVRRRSAERRAKVLS